MRSYNTAMSALAWLSLAVICMAVTAEGQAVRGRVTDLSVSRRRTPQFRDSRHGSAGVQYEWLQATVTYDIDVRQGDWIDELTLDWTALVRPGGRQPLLLKESVTYVDVEEGSHHAVIFIRPGFIRRVTGEKRPKDSDFAFRVELAVGGNRMAAENESRGRQPDNWWQAGPPHVRVVEGELLPRTETPFAHLDYDYFEHIKPKRR